MKNKHDPFLDYTPGLKGYPDEWLKGVKSPLEQTIEENLKKCHEALKITIPCKVVDLSESIYAKPGISYYKDGEHYYATSDTLYKEISKGNWSKIQRVKSGNESAQVIIDEFIPVPEGSTVVTTFTADTSIRDAISDTAVSPVKAMLEKWVEELEKDECSSEKEE